MRYEYSLTPLTKFLSQHDQPLVFIMAMLMVLLFIYLIGFAAIWFHEQWILRKMTRERSHSSKTRP